MSLTQLMDRISPREFSMWTHHLAEHPLNEDRRLHHIVAAIWVLLMQWSGAAKGQRIDAYTVAPWLRPKDYSDRMKQKADQTLERRYAAFYQSIGIYDIEIDEG